MVTDTEQDGLEVELEDDASSEGSSLEQRLKRHRAELDQYTTEKFPVPRWGHLVQVELGVVGYKRLTRIADSHRRLRDEAMRNLYIGADALLAATVGFWEVRGDSLDAAPGLDWVRLARTAYPELDTATTARVALIKMVSDDLLPEFVQEWRDWNRERGAEIDDELAVDLGATR